MPLEEKHEQQPVKEAAACMSAKHAHVLVVGQAHALLAAG